VLLTEDLNDNGAIDSNEGSLVSPFIATTANDYAVEVSHVWSNLKPNRRYFYELGFFPGGHTSGNDALVAPPRELRTPSSWTAPAGPAGGTGGGTPTQSPPPPSQTAPPPSQPPAASDQSTQNSVDGLKQGGGPNRPVAVTPKPAGAVADTTKPAGKIVAAPSQRLRTLVKGLKIGVTCSENVTAAATLVVDAKTAKALKLKGKKGKPVTIGGGNGSCTSAAPASITVRLLRNNASRVRKARKRWKATLTATLTDAAGNKALTAVKITFKP
jgi:hypothetical protein